MALFANIHIGPPTAYESDKLEGDEETLNLIFRIRGDKTKYKSDITVETDTTQRKPKVLFIGDSFIWSLGEFMPAREIMADREIWFYNNTAYVDFDNKTVSVKEIDRLSHILNADYVVFYSAGHQWWEATYGFAKDALLQLCVSDSLFEASVTDYANRFRDMEGNDDLTEEELRKNMAWMLRNDPELIPGLDGEEMPTIRNTERIEEALGINRIRNDKDWLNALSFYAVQHDMSTDEALREEAQRIAQGKSPLRDEIVIDTVAYIQMKKQQIMEQWRQIPEMTKMVQEKAQKRGLPFEVMLEKDIQWVLDRQAEEGKLFQ